MFCVQCVILFCYFFFLMIRRPPRSTRTDTLFPYTTLFRSILNEQREVMTTIRCLRPTIAIAIGFEVERTGQFECFTHALLDFGLDPVKTLGVDGIFEAGVQPLLAVAIVALRSEERRVGKGCVSTCRSRLSTDH